MGLQNTIENDMRIAMKNRDNKTSILKFICAEFQRRPNLNVDLTDTEVISIIRKFIKSYEENEKIVGYLTDEQKFEISVLSEYLPKIASADEIKSWIANNIEVPENQNARMKCMGAIMKNFAGRVDGNLVKEILMGF